MSLSRHGRPVSPATAVRTERAAGQAPASARASTPRTDGFAARRLLEARGTLSARDRDFHLTETTRRRQGMTEKRDGYLARLDGCIRILHAQVWDDRAAKEHKLAG